MTPRREFLKAGAVAAWRPVAIAVPNPSVLREAREWVQRGRLGRIGYCRIPHPGFLPALRFILDDAGPACVVELEPAIRGVQVLGSRATLTVTHTGCRLY